MIKPKLFAICKRCRKKYTGYFSLKNAGYFENFENFICNNCKKNS